MEAFDARKREYIIALLDCYGNALSTARRTALDLYFNEDFSLSEIADRLSITRQGVGDSIKKGLAELKSLDNALGFLSRENEYKALAAQILTHAGDDRIKSLASLIIEI